MLRLLIHFLVGIGLKGPVLWGAIKISASQCERNTLLHAFVFAAILNAVSFVPLYGPFLAIILFYMGLLRFYDLEPWHAFAVFIFLVAFEIFLVGLVLDLIMDGKISFAVILAPVLRGWV